MAHIRGVRTRRDDLHDRFAISRRLSARVGALLGRHTALTEAVLESAEPRSGLEAVLLRPELLEEAPDLDDERLAEWTAAAGGDVPRLRVVRDAGEEGEQWTTLALDEELQAARAEGGGGDAAGGELEVLSPGTVAGEMRGDLGLDADEIAGLFTPDEIAAIKLRVLTSVDEGERIEAVRRLVLTPVPGDEKARVLLKALTDGQPRVRVEAADGLRRLGLDHEITDAIKTLSTGDPEQKRFSLSRLLRLTRDAGQAERGVVMAVLFGALKDPGAGDVRAEAVRGLVPFADVLAGSAERHEDLTALLVEHVLSESEEMGQAAADLFRALHAAAPERTVSLLWEEVSGIAGGPARRLLLTVLGGLDMDDATRERTAEALVEEVVIGSELDRGFSDMVGVLRRMGDTGARALLARAEDPTVPDRGLLWRLLDRVAAAEGVDVEVRRRVLHLWRDEWKGAGHHLRMVVFESSLAQDEAIPEEDRRDLARVFVDNVHEYRLESVVDVCAAAVRRMGAAALEPVVDLVARARAPIQRRRGLRLLAELLRDASAEGDLAGRDDLRAVAARAVEACLRLTEDADEQADQQRRRGSRPVRGRTEADEPLADTLLPALGALAGSGLVPEEQVDTITGRLKERLRGRSGVAALDALGVLGGGAATPMPVKLEVGHLLIRLFEEELPQDFTRETTGAEGQVFELGGETMLYTDMIPALIEGMAVLATGPGAPDRLRDALVDSMLQRWEQAISYKLIWGPHNTTLLARALGRVGRHPSFAGARRVRIVEALVGRLNQVPVIEQAGLVCAVPDDDPDLDAAAARIAERLLALTSDPDFSERDERAAVLVALGRVLLHRDIERGAGAHRTDGPGGPRDGESERAAAETRAAGVELLFDGLRDGVREIADILRAAADSERFPPEMRDQIARRLRPFLPERTD